MDVWFKCHVNVWPNSLKYVWKKRNCSRVPKWERELYRESCQYVCISTVPNETERKKNPESEYQWMNICRTAGTAHRSAFVFLTFSHFSSQTHAQHVSYVRAMTTTITYAHWVWLARETEYEQQRSIGKENEKEYESVGMCVFVCGQKAMKHKENQVSGDNVH